MENAKSKMAIGDLVEFVGNGSLRYGRVEDIADHGAWFKIKCDGTYRTFRVENVSCFRNISVSGRSGERRSIRVNSEND